MQPQQMISLVRCSLLLNEGNSTDIDGYIFVEAQRILGFNELVGTIKSSTAIVRSVKYLSRASV